MYWEKDNTLQGEPRAEAVRFKQNLICFVFAGAAAGILLSFYTDFVTGAVVLFGACLISLLLKGKRVAVVLFFIALSFTRAGFYSPTAEQIKNAESMGVAVKQQEIVRYEFVFQDEIDFIRSIPERVLGEKRGAYVSGVMFGDKTNLDGSTKTAFRNAGISHILAVSGLHAGILMGVVNTLLKKVRRKIRLPVQYSFLVLLITASGFSPSVLRASLMMSVFLLADTFGYRYNLLNSLMLSGSIILLAVPYHLFNTGFLLSFTATLGIALFYPYLYCHLKRWGDYAGGGIAMYIACQITSLPILIIVFKELSVLGVLGNLFTIPIVSFALVSALIGLVFYPFGLAYYPLSYSAAFMELIEYAAEIISSVSFSTVAMGSVPVIAAVIYYAAIGLLCVFAFRDRKPVYTAIAGCMAIMLVCGLVTL